MASIYVGSAATNRAAATTAGITYIDKANPVDGNGHITNVDLYVASQLSGCKVGIFYTASDVDHFTCRSSVSLGTVATGLRSSSVDLEAKVGDFIGVYSTGGTVDRVTTGGEGVWICSGDQTVCSNTAFTRQVKAAISAYGTGETLSASMKLKHDIIFGV
jgi:hypothetical protein